MTLVLLRQQYRDLPTAAARMGFAAHGFVVDIDITDEEKQPANKAMRVGMSKSAATLAGVWIGCSDAPLHADADRRMPEPG